MFFADRADAGRQLATRLKHLSGGRVVVLGLPRGGVPVALEVARALGAPLDVIVVRKLGVPFQPELGMGAVGEDGVSVINDDVVRLAGIGEADLAAAGARERAEVERRAALLRKGRPRQRLDGRVAVVVDDGIATGGTARAACRVARAQGAARVVLAVPVAPPGWEATIGEDADELVCLETPPHFYAIGQFYADFSQTSDDEVIACLSRATEPAGAPPGAGPAGAVPPGAVPPGAVPPGTGPDAGRTARADPPHRGEDVEVRAGTVVLRGQLVVPHEVVGLVVFAHGSGTARHSPRNRYMASVLNQAGLGTFLLDLLTSAEEYDPANVFDIRLLTRRLAEVTDWLRARPAAAGLAIGYFGAATGAAAALLAASEQGSGVAAVVSRSGRPDLAGSRLGLVQAPTLLIVAQRDDVLIGRNRQAQAGLRCENDLKVVPGATYLFEEQEALATVADLARDWFTAHLAST